VHLWYKLGYFAKKDYEEITILETEVSKTLYGLISAVKKEVSSLQSTIYNLMSKPIIFIVGPTATGKTEVSFLLAKKLGAEIVSADAMLVYKEPSIITSKPQTNILEEVKHHFVGIVSTQESYSVFDYSFLASKVIEELFKKNVPVIVSGGSGLYLKAILDGIFEGPGKDENLRKELTEIAATKGNEYLYNKLQKIDPESAQKISSKDLRRIIRALEVHSLSGQKMSEKKKEASGLWGKLPIEIFGLRFKRENLYQRINIRTDAMFKQGVVDEVKELISTKLSLTAKKILGISEIEGFLKGDLSQEESKELMKKNTRNFAKRQNTWFKKDKRIQWIDMDQLSVEQAVDDILGRSHD